MGVYCWYCGLGPPQHPMQLPCRLGGVSLSGLGGLSRVLPKALRWLRHLASDAVDVHLAGGAAISFAWCVQKLLTLAVVDMQIGGAVPSTLVPCHWGAGVSDTVNNIDKFIVAAVSAALGSPFASPATVPIG